MSTMIMHNASNQVVVAASVLFIPCTGQTVSEAPVMLETLTTLRATLTIGPSAIYGRNERGEPYLIEDKMMDRFSAISALMKSFDVPMCIESDAQERGEMLFDFAIQQSQRLVDALDDLREKTDGYIQWRLLNGRIIIIAGQSLAEKEVYLMDRTIRVDIEVPDLAQVFLDIETAYNEQYPDLPLIFTPSCLNINYHAPFTSTEGPRNLVIKTEAPLREILLRALEENGEPWLRYHLCETFDHVKRRYYDMRINDLRDCRDEFKSGEEIDRTRAENKARYERLDNYLNRAEQLRNEPPLKQPKPSAESFPEPPTE